MANPFFKNHGPFKITELIEILKLKDLNIGLDLEVFDKLHELIRKDAQDIKSRFKPLNENNNWQERINNKISTLDEASN